MPQQQFGSSHPEILSDLGVDSEDCIEERARWVIKIARILVLGAMRGRDGRSLH
jgi:hypothetical protein